MCERERECVCKRERERKRVCVREREIKRVCVRERERKRDRVCVRERECACVRERERERTRGYDNFILKSGTDRQWKSEYLVFLIFFIWIMNIA